MNGSTTGVDIERLIDLTRTSQKVDPLLAAGLATPGAALSSLADAGAVTNGDRIALDILIAADVDEARALAALTAAGMEGLAVMGRTASGWIDADLARTLGDLAEVQYVRAVYGEGQTGSVGEEGSLALNADAGRAEFGVDGTGVSVGVLSDSFDALDGAADDRASGDLPDVEVLEDASGTDEGRAMLQIIHDVAPGADLLFHTALGGQANFAQGILDLVAAGAQVIVDDIVYLAEPFFQDGLVARAVDEAFEAGVAYFSSAGNADRSSYEAAFDGSGEVLFLQGSTSMIEFGEMHDFDAGAGVDVRQRVFIPQSRDILITFQWDEPFASVSADGRGSASDLDILLFGADGDLVTSNLFAFSASFNIDGDPVEVFRFVNTTGMTEFDLVISHFGGPTAGLMKYVELGGATIVEHATDSAATFGHAPAEGAMSVGAARFLNTPNFGQEEPILEGFSSKGPAVVLFDDDGERLDVAEVRASPDIVAPDGTNNTFFGSDTFLDADTAPNFFGTSAAAPHAAAVAALMLELNPDLTPDEIYAGMQASAIDMGAAGFDFENGAGLVDAAAALAAIEPETLAPLASEGDDTLVGSDQADRIDGLGGDDVLLGGAGADDLRGDAGDDLIIGDGDDDYLAGGDGADRVLGRDGDDNLRGDDGLDELWGGAGQDQLQGGNDADLLRGEAGDDVINGNSGADRILGGAGADLLRGNNGADFIIGGVGDDELRGGDDNDILRGNEGLDELRGEAGDDLMFGGADADDLRGAEGDDQLRGEEGEDRLYGDAGDDRIEGGDGDDVSRGGGGADVLLGDAGDDRMYGDAGDDILDGGAGRDRLIGGAGADSFRLLDGDAQDIIYDFVVGEDILVFAGGAAAVGVIEDTIYADAAAIIAISDGVEVLLAGVTGVDFEDLIALD